MKDLIVSGKVFRHFKGGLYEIVTLAVMESDLQEVVVYRSLDSEMTFVRPLESFLEEAKGKEFLGQKRRFVAV